MLIYAMGNKYTKKEILRQISELEKRNYNDVNKGYLGLGIIKKGIASDFFIEKKILAIISKYSGGLIVEVEHRYDMGCGHFINLSVEIDRSLVNEIKEKLNRYCYIFPRLELY